MGAPLGRSGDAVAVADIAGSWRGSCWRAGARVLVGSADPQCPAETGAGDGRRRSRGRDPQIERVHHRVGVRTLSRLVSSAGGRAGRRCGILRRVGYSMRFFVEDGQPLTFDELSSGLRAIDPDFRIEADGDVYRGDQLLGQADINATGDEHRGGRSGSVWATTRSDLAPLTTSQAGSAIRVPIRTKLQAVTADSAQSWLRRVPMYRSLRPPPTAFSQPKISSTRFRIRWLTR